MKRIYEEYLHVPKDGKIKEKVFIMRIAIAIVCMVCCLSAMGFSAYAFFTSSITSGSNTIVAATYGVEVVITSSEGAALTAKADSPLLYEDVAAGTYTVSLKASGTAQNGYCKIEIVGSEKTVTLFSQPLPPETSMSFTLVTNGKASITITPQWGTYSNRDVVASDKSTQEVQLVEAGKNVTTPSSSGVSQILDANEEITAGSQPENQTNKEESSDASSNDSHDEKDSNDTTVDGMSDETSNGENNDDNSETVQDGNVIE